MFIKFITIISLILISLLGHTEISPVEQKHLDSFRALNVDQLSEKFPSLMNKEITFKKEISVNPFDQNSFVSEVQLSFDHFIFCAAIIKNWYYRINPQVIKLNSGYKIKKITPITSDFYYNRQYGIQLELNSSHPKKSLHIESLYCIEETSIDKDFEKSFILNNNDLKKLFKNNIIVSD